MWLQKEILLKARQRGFALITEEIVAALPELRSYRIGLLHLSLQHTSASLTINENADPDVRTDLESFCNRLTPEGSLYFRHICEGSDDMPAHIKSSLLGSDLTIPIRSGRLVLGTWQGVYLGEHRDHGGARRLVATIQGEYNTG